MRTEGRVWLMAVVVAGFLACAGSKAVAGGFAASEAEDLKIDREAVFEFAGKPSVRREGDRVTISFETRGFCDVSVAIESSGGKILRHLAYGVLGPNAPEPFRKNSRKQVLVWDGKDDRGRYVAERKGVPGDVVVRVSLGLKPRLERNLFWHPRKRMGMDSNPLMVAQPEGVYVYDGAAVETVRLFGHDGKYIRTVYPWSAADIAKVKGLKWHTFGDGYRAPQHFGGKSQQAFLYSGTGSCRGGGPWGSYASAMDVRDGSIALISGYHIQTPKQYVNRLCRLGVGRNLNAHAIHGPRTGTPRIPKSCALSPDKKWLYVTGFYEARRGASTPGINTTKTGWSYGVYRMEFDGNRPAALWKGAAKKPGKGENDFNYPTSVCVDARGRVYVSDHFNDRVQIFSPGGRLLKSLAVDGPAVVQIHHQTQELYVFSWTMALAWAWDNGRPSKAVTPMLRVFSPFKGGKPREALPLPLENRKTRTLQQNPGDGVGFRVALDSYTNPVTLWMCSYHPEGRRARRERLQVSRFRLEGGKIKLLERWNDEVARTVVELLPRRTTRRRMSVDHRTGMLYVEGSSGPAGRTGVQPSPVRAFGYLYRIDPESGKVGRVKLPISATDFAIDDSGHLYLRKRKLLARFDLDTMREVPFDYGERHGGFISALVLSGYDQPGSSTGWESGIGVNSRGDIVVSSMNNGNYPPSVGGRGYVPQVYPGRALIQDVHVFDRHGKILVQDAIKGTPAGYGTFIDNRRNLYFLAGASRIWSGKKQALRGTGCAMKFRPGKGRFYATAGAKIPLPGDAGLKGLPRLSMPPKTKFYVEGAEWIFPGAGWVPQYCCECWNSRFAVDHFGRSFVPQHNRYQVAILDTGGNLVAQVGRYGNVDDGKPLIANGDRRSEPARPLGGDEVALAYACYTGTFSDRYLFIYDAGNDCIRSVKLDYHVSEKLPVR